jgi:hypothetical protein
MQKNAVGLGDEAFGRRLQRPEKKPQKKIQRTS